MKNFQHGRKQPEVTGVRLGEMRGQVEKHCKALGIDLSEFIRGSIQRAIRPNPLEALASLFGVCHSFRLVIDAAYRLGWITAEQAADFDGANSDFELTISNRLNAVFAEENPEIVTLEQEGEKKLKAWQSAHKDQAPPEELVVAAGESSVRKRWHAGLARAFSVSDLQIVENALRSLRVDGVDLRRIGDEQPKN